MPTNVRPLDQSQLYTYCETCAANGNPKSPLRREMDTIQCGLGHRMSSAASMTVRPFSGDLPETASMSMVKLVDYQPESPNQTDVAWKIFVHPDVKAKIESKFAGRVIVTLGTFLAAIADGSIVMIMNEDARKLKAMGVSNGRDMVAAMESTKQTEKERDDAVQQIERFQQILKAAGVA